MDNNNFEKFPGEVEREAEREVPEEQDFAKAFESGVPEFAGSWFSEASKEADERADDGGSLSETGGEEKDDAEYDEGLTSAAALINYGLDAASRELGVEQTVQRIKDFDATNSENPIRDLYQHLGVKDNEVRKDVMLEAEAARVKEAEFREEAGASGAERRSKEGAFKAIEDMKELITEVEEADPRYQALREGAKVAGKGYFDYAVEDFGTRGLTELFGVLARQKEEEKKRKSYQDKAVEKGYHRDENGDWWESNGDGFDEEAKWFKLDEEYPELADRTEELAEKYGVEYSDFGGGMKRAIYQNAEKLNGASDEQLKNIFQIAKVITFMTGGTEQILVNYDEEELDKISEALGEYYEKVIAELGEDKIPRLVERVAECVVRNYNDGLVREDFLEKLAEYTMRGCTDRENGYKIINGIECGIEGLAKNEGEGADFGKYMQRLTELMNDREKITKFDTRKDLLMRYVRDHGVNEAVLTGFDEVIFPLLEQGDEEVRAIMEGGNAYGVGEGDYGIADYVEECLMAHYRPDEIDRLARIYHEIPTSDYQRFEQNRKDAARLQGTVIGGRDFVHDEMPGTHEMLVAIEEYYDHREDENIDDYRRKLEELEGRYHFGVLPNALKLEEYERPVRYMSDGNVAEQGNPDEKAIDILRRLVKNTTPNLAEKPMTKYDELNALMARINPLIDEKTGDVRVSMAEIGPAINELNKILQNNYGKQGVMPSTVEAVAYLDKMAFYAIQGMDRKEAEGAVFDPNFKEMMRFRWLTSSGGYDEAEFEAAYRKIANKCGEAYGGDAVDLEKVREGYRLLSQDVLKDMDRLAKKYSAKKNTKRFVEAIWSGNLNDALIGMYQKM